MTRYLDAIKRMRAGKCMLIDGATATELERRGVPQLKNAWNGGGALSHPNILKEIHSEYISLGAKLIISNTFATCRHTLEDADQAHNFKKLNSEGVRLALEARSDSGANEVLVGGGISYWSFTGRNPSLSQLNDNISEQASILANAGSDLLILEMMKDVDRLVVTLEAALKTGLPVWVGLSCKKNIDGNIVLLGGESLKDAIVEISNSNIDFINIMHTEIDDVDDCLDILDHHWGGLRGVYAHSGTFKDSKSDTDAENTDWTFEDVISPEAYAEYTKKWASRDINLIGGCCGISTEHMRYVSQTMGYS